MPMAELAAFVALAILPQARCKAANQDKREHT